MVSVLRTVSISVLVSLLVGGGSALAVAGVAGSGQIREGTALNGCLDSSSGTLSLLPDSSECKTGTIPVTWKSSAEAAGKPGEKGQTGEPGPSGSAGEPGSAGEAGVPGNTGSSGVPGAQGAPGRQGAPGAGGVSGQPGTPGTVGAPGTAGAPGAPGAPGAAGAQGARGEKGDAGTAAWSSVSEWSASATYTAGPPAALVTYQGGTYVAARSSVAASPKASASDWILIAAAGIKGDTGEKGDKGDTGNQGATGLVGPIGLSGPLGPEGPSGTQGIQGLQGLQGLQGQQGVQGATGVASWKFQGAYSATAVYSAAAPASVVQFEGSTWIATRTEPFTGVAPTDASAWALLSAAGAVGQVGATGATGPAGPRGPEGSSWLTREQFGAVQDLANKFGHDLRPVWQGGRGNNDCTLGEVIYTAGVFGLGTPADGRLLDISQNTALFTLLGTIYGGNGQQNFALPDLRATTPTGLIASICTFGIYPSRE